MLDLVPPILEPIETLLQTGGAQPLSNGVYQAVQLPHYLGEFALFGLMVRVVFAALEVDFVLKGSDEFFNKLCETAGPGAHLSDNHLWGSVKSKGRSDAHGGHV